MTRHSLFLFILILSLLLSACGAPAAAAETADPALSQDSADMFTRRDMDADFDEDGAVAVRLNGDSIRCADQSVRISGTTATITAAGTYVLSGELTDGRIVVEAEKSDKVRLVLSGASVTCENSAPLYILKADKVFLTLAPGTENSLINGGSFVAVDENNIDAAVFSKQDLTLNGSGSLSVISPAGHGIVSKDDLVFTGGAYTVSAASHGLEAKDSVRVTGASIAIDAGKDGIHAENDDDTDLGFVYISGGELTITAEGDGISAGSTMRVEGGVFDITAGGGSANAEPHSSDFPGGGFMGRRGPGSPFQTVEETAEDSGVSAKGLKAEGELQITGGTFVINAADDAVHSNGSITVSGGEFEIATGDDGFHADEKLTVTGGDILITESYEGLEALELEIAGGDIRLTASDDGLNAAGGKDESGFGGPRGGDRFGGPRGGDRPGNPQDGRGGGASSSSSNASILISGGTLYIKASGDGIDSNGTLTITGGSTTVVCPIQGDTSALDYDVSGEITGGTFVGTGAAGMAQTFSASQQGVISVNAGNQPAGTRIALTDAAGNTLLSTEPELPFSVVILSSPELKTGESYTLTVGSASGTFTAS